MGRLQNTVYQTNTPEGARDVVSCLPPEQVLPHGLAPKAIIGLLKRPLEPGETITPPLFTRNRVFVDFLHELLARRAPQSPDCMAEAQRQGNGWVYLIDQRTPTPAGRVPPEDIIGAFEIRNGAVVAGSYTRSPEHRLLSANGFFQLGDELTAYLMEELADLCRRWNSSSI
jgi:hypothetical protein